MISVDSLPECMSVYCMSSLTLAANGLMRFTLRITAFAKVMNVVTSASSPAIEKQLCCYNSIIVTNKHKQKDVYCFHSTNVV